VPPNHGVGVGTAFRQDVYPPFMPEHRERYRDEGA
jgi:hypothetical protein